MQLIKQYGSKPTLLIIGFIALMFVMLVAIPIEASAANAQSQVCNGIGGTGGGNNCSTGGPSLSATVKNVINILSIIVGAVAVFMVILGGFRYVTSAGDANKSKGARDTILFAIVGLIIVAIAQAIVQFVLQKV